MTLKNYINKIKVLLFYLLLLSTLFFTEKYYDSYQLTKSFGILFLFFLFFIILLFFENQKIQLNFILFFYFLFIFYLFFKILVTPHYLPSYYTGVLISSLIFFILNFLYIDIKKFLLFANLLVFLSCIYSIFQFFLNKIRPYSFFGNPIFFAEFLVIFAPFIFISYYFFKKNHLFFSFNIVLILICFILSSSRGPIIAFLFSLTFLFFLLSKYLNFSKTFKFNLFFVLLFFIIIFLIPDFNSAFKYNFSRIKNLFSYNEPAIKTRILTSSVAFSLFKENTIFGKSPGSFRYYFPKYQAEILKQKTGFDFINTSYVHNDYLQFLSEFGFLGLLFFLLFLFSILFLFQKFSYYLSDKIFIFSVACVASLLGILIESFFNFPLFILPSAFLFYLIAGVLYKNLLNFSKFSFLNLNQKIFSFIFLFSLIFISFFKPFDYISNFYLNYGINLTLKYLPKDREYIQKAIDFNPKNFLNYYFMANAYASIRRYDDAISFYEKCLLIYPYSSDILFNIGAMYRWKGDLKKAEEYFKKALYYYPDFPDAHFHLGKIYQKKGLIEEADKEFAIAARLKPVLFEDDFKRKVILFTETTFEFDNFLKK